MDARSKAVCELRRATIPAATVSLFTPVPVGVDEEKLKKALEGLKSWGTIVSAPEEFDYVQIEPSEGLLSSIQQEAHEFARENGYWKLSEANGLPRPDQFPEKIALVHSEASEALEAYRDLLSVAVAPTYTPAFRGVLQHVWYNEEEKDLKPEGVPIELADVVIRVADIAEAFGIDLEDAVLKKMAWNREYKGKAVKEGEGVTDRLED